MSVEAMISKMESQLGVVGRPNAATNWYADRNGSYFRNAAWCNMLITWAAHQSGNYDAVCFGTDYAYTVWHAQRFEQAGRWHVDTAGIRRGDIVFFDWSGSNNVWAIDHVGIVTDVNGRDIMTIEGNTSDRCARRVRHADTIVGYGRPDYAVVGDVYTVVAGDTLSKIGRETGHRWQDIAALNGLASPYLIHVGDELRLPGSPTAPPPPPPPEPPVPYTPPPLPAGLRPNSSRPSAKPLQAALKKAGYMSESIAPADNYGPATQAAVRKFYIANASHGWSPSTSIGPLGWAELHREAYGSGTVTPPPPPPPPPVDDGEPAHDYRRVTYGGKTVNVRTREMLKKAVEHLAEHYEWTPVLTQGSYNTGVSASAGTHDGGGVVDIRTSTMSRSGQDKCVQALRKAGFAAWLRLPPAFGTHIHAVAIGDRELSPSAKSQIEQWREDTNGLANHGPDPEPDPYPAWTAKYR